MPFSFYHSISGLVIKGLRAVWSNCLGLCSNHSISGNQMQPDFGLPLFIFYLFSQVPIIDMQFFTEYFKEVFCLITSDATTGLRHDFRVLQLAWKRQGTMNIQMVDISGCV
jgi:hypothetical protein